MLVRTVFQKYRDDFNQRPNSNMAGCSGRVQMVIMKVSMAATYNRYNAHFLNTLFLL